MDWGIATLGPSSLDLVTFCVGGMSNVDMTRDQLLAAARDGCRDLVDDAAFAAAELWALVELGWNKVARRGRPPRSGQAGHRAGGP